MLKYRPVLLAVFVISVLVLIWINTGTREELTKSACHQNESANYCNSLMRHQQISGRYSLHPGIEISLSIVAIISGTAYIYSSLP